MSLKPENAIQLYHEAQKASGLEHPPQSEFYKIALEKGDNKLTSALNSMKEEDFVTPEKCISKLDTLHFKAKNSKSKSWAEKISTNNHNFNITSSK